MRAKFKSLDGTSGAIEYEAIVPQPMTHVDGFTLLGFNSWEDVQDEKLACAITNVSEFYLDKEKGRLGFHNENSN